MSIKIVTGEITRYSVKRRSKLNPLTMQNIEGNPNGKPLYKKNKKAEQEYVDMIKNIEYQRQQQARLENE